MTDNESRALEIGEQLRSGGTNLVVPRLYTISEVASELGRVPHTVRVWEYDKRLPNELLPTRNARGWRVWTRQQIEGLKRWIIEEDLTPGKGLRNSANSK
jgi:hypothetical protein